MEFLGWWFLGWNLCYFEGDVFKYVWIYYFDGDLYV